MPRTASKRRTSSSLADVGSDDDASYTPSPVPGGKSKRTRTEKATISPAERKLAQAVNKKHLKTHPSGSTELDSSLESEDLSQVADGTQVSPKKRQKRAPAYKMSEDEKKLAEDLLALPGTTASPAIFGALDLQTGKLTKVTGPDALPLIAKAQQAVAASNNAKQQLERKVVSSIPRPVGDPFAHMPTWLANRARIHAETKIMDPNLFLFKSPMYFTNIDLTRLALKVSKKGYINVVYKGTELDVITPAFVAANVYLGPYGNWACSNPPRKFLKNKQTEARHEMRMLSVNHGYEPAYLNEHEQDTAVVAFYDWFTGQLAPRIFGMIMDTKDAGKTLKAESKKAYDNWQREQATAKRQGLLAMRGRVEFSPEEQAIVDNPQWLPETSDEIYRDFVLTRVLPKQVTNTRLPDKGAYIPHTEYLSMGRPVWTRVVSEAHKTMMESRGLCFKDSADQLPPDHKFPPQWVDTMKKRWFIEKYPPADPDDRKANARYAYNYVPIRKAKDGKIMDWYRSLGLVSSGDLISTTIRVSPNEWNNMRNGPSISCKPVEVLWIKKGSGMMAKPVEQEASVPVMPMGDDTQDVPAYTFQEQDNTVFESEEAQAQVTQAEESYRQQQMALGGTGYNAYA